MIRRAFTLIETMLAVLLLAMVASAAVITFAGPVARARGEDAIEQLRTFDTNARTAAVAGGRSVRMVFDVSHGRMERRDGPTLNDLRFEIALPAGVRIDSVRFPNATTSNGDVSVELSPMGLSRTYAVHLVGPAIDRWVAVAGMTGDVTVFDDESTLQDIFAATR